VSAGRREASKVYIIGAGLAGLSAAVALAARGVQVELIEASSQAGGRCRSYHDPVLDMTLDNGNHFILSGNHATFGYLRSIGAEDRVTGPATAVLDFCDLADGARWKIQPNDGPIPWWLLFAGRRVPGTRLAEYAALAPLVAARDDRRIAEVVACRGPLWRGLIEPFLVGALNCAARDGAAALAGAVLRQSLARGGRAYRTRIAHPNLSAAFIDPALAFLRERGAQAQFGRPVRALGFSDQGVVTLDTADGPIDVGERDCVILATPAWVTPTLAPGVTAPDRFSPIVNAHFKIAAPANAAPMLGVIGGTAQWIFAFADRLSVTVSAAEAIVDEDREALAGAFWRDIASVYGLGPTPPPWRIIKERRATFSATPQQNARRPGATTRWRNLILAGDWTATGLPSTIEGAVRSGNTAAAAALKFGGGAVLG
jgi:squalene-associated FAD-dependent desaturase